MTSGITYFGIVLESNGPSGTGWANGPIFGDRLGGSSLGVVVGSSDPPFGLVGGSSDPPGTDWASTPTVGPKTRIADASSVGHINILL
jgi:hypothetical protein